MDYVSRWVDGYEGRRTAARQVCAGTRMGEQCSGGGFSLSYVLHTLSTPVFFHPDDSGWEGWVCPGTPDVARVKCGGPKALMTG